MLQTVQPIIVQSVDQAATKELSMGDIILQALGLSGGILLASLVLGVLAGCAFIWYRRRQESTRIDGEAGDQIRLRLEPPTLRGPGGSVVPS